MQTLTSLAGQRMPPAFRAAPLCGIFAVVNFTFVSTCLFPYLFNLAGHKGTGLPAQSHTHTCTHTHIHTQRDTCRHIHTHREILMYVHTHSHKDFFHFKVYFQSSWLVVKWTALFLNYILTVLVVILPGSRTLQGWKTRFLLRGFSGEGI